MDQPFILALDDFQVIQDSTILPVLEQLVINPPPPLHLVLLTREDPPLPLARLRANDRLTEIRAADLRFTSEEAGRLLRGTLGLEISEQDASLLDERTEGWAAGLHLAGLSIRDRADPSAFIRTLSGGHRHILEYLTEEVLNRQTAADQEFLMQTSVLERLCGGLCDAVTGRADGRETLERLYRANLFLVPLDDEGRWYRYHQLFAEMLADRRKSLPAEITAGFHRRASEWYAHEGMAGEAVRHALAAGDYAAAVIQIETHAMDMLMQWHVKTVDGWMRSIPAGWSARSIRANLAFAWIHMIRGEPLKAAPHLAQLQALFAESRHAELDDPSLNAKWLAIQAMMLNARGLAAEGLALGRKALALVPETDFQVRCLVHLAIAGSCEPLDDTPGIEHAFAEIVRYGREAGNSVYELLGISGLALSAIKHGRLHFAYELASAGIRQMEGSGALPPVATAVYGELATVCYQWHELDEAHRHFRRAIQVGMLAGFSDAELFHGVILSRLHLIEGNLPAAEQEIRKSADRMRVEAPVVVREEVIAQQVRVELALQRPAEAERIMQAEGFSFSGGFSAPDSLPGRTSGALYTAALRILLSRARSGNPKTGLEAGLGLADRLIAEAVRRGLVFYELELHLLRAQLHSVNKNDRSAREDLKAALSLGEPEGYVTIFIEEGAGVGEMLPGMMRESALAGISAEYVAKDPGRDQHAPGIPDGRSRPDDRAADRARTRSAEADGAGPALRGGGRAAGHLPEHGPLSRENDLREAGRR